MLEHGVRCARSLVGLGPLFYSFFFASATSVFLHSCMSTLCLAGVDGWSLQLEGYRMGGGGLVEGVESIYGH